MRFFRNGQDTQLESERASDISKRVCERDFDRCWNKIRSNEYFAEVKHNRHIDDQSI